MRSLLINYMESILNGGLKMRWYLPTLFATAALLAPSLAVGQKVRTDYAHGTDFSKYKTYKWVKVSDNPDLNQLMDQRIKGAFEAELTKEGLTQVQDNPDLLIGYQAAVSHETQLNTFSSDMGGPGYGYGARWGYGWGGGSSMSTTTSSTIRNGTLVLDLMDPKAKQLIFRGVATDSLSDKPEKNIKKIEKSAKKIFEKYPPKVD
jgi:Domain of unknown function (DUF4136)